MLWNWPKETFATRITTVRESTSYLFLWNAGVLYCRETCQHMVTIEGAGFSRMHLGRFPSTKLVDVECNFAHDKSCTQILLIDTTSPMPTSIFNNWLNLDEFRLRCFVSATKCRSRMERRCLCWTWALGGEQTAFPTTVIPVLHPISGAVSATPAARTMSLGDFEGY